MTLEWTRFRGREGGRKEGRKEGRKGGREGGTLQPLLELWDTGSAAGEKEEGNVFFSHTL
jgi:hypothetical protein